MKFTFRPIYAFLPAIALCAILVAAMSTHTTPTHAHAQQDIQTSAHALRPHAVSATVTQGGVGLYTCIPGSPDCSGSVITQFSGGEQIQVQCQVHISGDPTGGWWSTINSSDYGTGWLNNAYISGGPGAIANVPACSSK